MAIPIHHLLVNRALTPKDIMVLLLLTKLTFTKHKITNKNTYSPHCYRIVVKNIVFTFNTSFMLKCLTQLDF